MATNDGSNNNSIATSKSITESGFFDAGTRAISEIADVAEKKGLKTTSLAFGVVIVLALIGEFLSTRDYIPHHGEIICLIIGGLLIIIPVLLNELDYKWELHATLRKKELVTERLRIEADFEIARLEATKLRLKPAENENGDGPNRPK